MTEVDHERQDKVGKRAMLEIGRATDTRSTRGKQTIQILVEVLDVKYGYGRIIAEVTPVGGFGRWDVNMDRLNFIDSDS